MIHQFPLQEISGSSDMVSSRRAGRISIQGVNKSYGEAQVLFDIDLEIAAAEIVCFIGLLGSANSTLLRCIKRSLKHIKRLDPRG